MVTALVAYLRRPETTTNDNHSARELSRYACKNEGSETDKSTERLIKQLRQV